MTSSTEMTTESFRPFDDLGPALVGRKAGATLRARILLCAQTAPVIVDLTGIELISPSFADELFAKLPPDVIRDRRVRFSNASDDIRALARGVRGLRRAVAHT